MIFARGPRVLPKDVPVEIRNAVGAQSESHEKTGSTAKLLSGSMEDAERAMINAALKACDGNISKAAKRLHISRRTLHRKLNLYGEPADEGGAKTPVQ